MYYTTDQKIEIIKQKLSEGWSVHVSFREARVTKEDNKIIREKLKPLIDQYNKSVQKKMRGV